jgi:copper(I)-binding protein
MTRWLLAAIAMLSIGTRGAMAAAPSPITARDAWFRYLLPEIPAGGFVTLHNAGASPAVLTGVRSAACGMAMLHRSVNRSGVDRMSMVPSVTVPAHGDFRFAPGGYHIMCMQPHMKPGDAAAVTLLFAGLPPMVVKFAVYGADGKPATP